MSVSAVADSIRARLEATVKAAGLVRLVYSQSEYSALPESGMATPSLAVIYTGYAPGGQVGQGRVQNVEFGFLVSVNVRNARNSATVDAVQADASPIFDAVLAELLGWRPLPKFQPLKLEAAPGAAHSDAGFGYYPLAFSTTGTYRATPTT